MSSKLWFLQDLEEVIGEHKEFFGTSKNSWYNRLFTSIHFFCAQKFLEREELLKDMMAIYDNEKPAGNALGFVLPSKKQQLGALEFNLLNQENVEKMRPLREQNQKLNEQLIILQDFLAFLYSIDPKEEILQEQYFPQLEGLFEKWWEEQLALQTKKSEETPPAVFTSADTRNI